MLSTTPENSRRVTGSYTAEQAASMVDIDPRVLGTWVKHGLVIPYTFGARGTSKLFTDQMIEKMRRIKKLKVENPNLNYYDIRLALARMI